MTVNEKYVIENEEFLRTVLNATTIEEAKRICAEYNTELPDDVWEDIENAFASGEESLGELSCDELDNVSGGKFNGKNLLTAAGSVIALGGAIAAGAPIGVLVACGWVGYNVYKIFK